MKRRLILVTCLIGIIGGSAGAALADNGNDHQVCVVFANNQNYRNTQAVCVDVPGN